MFPFVSLHLLPMLRKFHHILRDPLKLRALFAEEVRTFQNCISGVQLRLIQLKTAEYRTLKQLSPSPPT